MRVRHCLATLAIVALVSCDDPTPSGPVVVVPAALLVVGGDGQTGTAGAPLADAITVRVASANGSPVKGTTVRFAMVSGGGEILVENATSDDQGLARARWTLGTVAANSQVVEASLASFPAVAAVRLRATARAAAPADLQPVGAGPFAGGVGSALADSLAVTIKDSFGNPVPGLEVAWEVGAPVRGASVHWSLSPGSGTLSSASFLTDAQGRSRVAWTLGTVAGAQQAFAAVDSGTITFAATARAGPPAVVVADAGSGQAGTRNTILVDSLVARVTDRAARRAAAAQDFAAVDAFPAPGRRQHLRILRGLARSGG